MIMSTLALKLAGDIAPARKSTARPGFWKRLFEARQAQADRVVCAHLGAMGDATLERLGYTAADILALRAGRLPKPARGG
jgi:hypothetical protein